MFIRADKLKNTFRYKHIQIDFTECHAAADWLTNCELTLMCMLHHFTIDLYLNGKEKPLDAHKIS